LAGRAAELASAVDRLDLMTTENLSVAAAFDLSYEDLTPGQQRLFRRLGLHPGTDIDAHAAAALDGADVAAVRRGLEALYDQYLLTEVTQGRYRLHDLIREHARALADRFDSGDERDLASARLLNYYQHTAARANTFLARQTRTASSAASSAASSTADGSIPAAVPALASREHALAWARAERTSMLACLDQATRAGQHARVVALTAGLAGLLRQDGPWAEAIARHSTALRAAGHLGDRTGQAGALNDLGHVRQLTGDYPAATGDLEEALGIYRDLGDRLGQANALHSLGHGRWEAGDFPAAGHALEEALGIYRDLGSRHGQANTLLLLAGARRGAGDYPAAGRALEEALGIYRDLGARSGEVDALNEAGTLHRVLGDLDQAVSCHRQALDLARQIDSSRDEAHALAGLGRCALVAGRTTEAEDKLRLALEIFQRLGAAETADLTAELDAMRAAAQPASDDAAS
jgi:tetratricopeptide (TPR) repeat protein